MEENNNNNFKPSKKFLIRGGIATGILALILIVQTPWFLSLFSGKKSKNLVVNNSTIGEIVGKDSNSNGIADWEEKLWGLDPNVTTTNGVSNKSIIEAKRRSLQSENISNNELNETDRLARELFGFTTAIGSEGSIDKSSLNAMASKLGQENVAPDTVPTYTIKNLVINPTNRKNLTTYQQSISASLKKYETEVPEIDTFIRSIETGDYSNLESFDLTILFYKNLSKQLIKIPAPVGVAQFHLDIVNSLVGLSNGFEKMKTIEDNGINALVGLSEYRYHGGKLTSTIEKLNVYLNEYGIIQ